MKKNTRHLTFFILFFITNLSCSNQVNKLRMSDFELFKSYIQGDFDNSGQVADEQASGGQKHPLAKHINRLVDVKIKNLPPQYNGFYILEESYYTYPNKPTEIKPYLFWFEPTQEGSIKLHSLALPSNLDKKDIRNDNLNLSFDFNELKESPTFTPAVYTKTGRGFYVNHTINLPNNMTFTLEETIGKDFLEVMETLKKEDKILTPYNSPIQYKRLKKS
jgi:hypothetical protein